VYVHQLELLAQRDLVLLDGQRERIGRVLEQRVVGGHDLVEGHALGEPAPQPERAGVRDEVDLVAAPRELEPQLGGDGSGATVGGVAGDPYAHASSAFSCQPSANHGMPAFEDPVGQGLRALRRVEQPHTVTLTADG